jgi:hypothetical protein
MRGDSAAYSQKAVFETAAYGVVVKLATRPGNFLSRAAKWAANVG